MSVILQNFDKYYEDALEVFQNRSINVDVTHRCLLQCPFCSRQSYDGKDMVRQSQIMYGDLYDLNAEDIGNTFDVLSLCGQISDPIYHSNFLNIMKIFMNTSCKRIDIHTTGSHKKKDWWKELVEISADPQKNVRFIFGIDGIDEKSSYHRINQNTDQAFEAMKVVSDYLKANKDSNIEVIWQYIPFKYNENDIDKAIDIANDIGVKLLMLKSGRFRTSGNILEPPSNPDLFNTKQFAERVYINE
mgnify:FL=1